MIDRAYLEEFTRHANNESINQLLTGRILPEIYIFHTKYVPAGYLKLGDTTRTVPVRIAEWKEKYDDIALLTHFTAMNDNNEVFRDKLVHEVLQKEFHCRNMKNGEQDAGKYYSNEFFKSTEPGHVTINDMVAAIERVQKNPQKYRGRYYTLDDHSAIVKSFRDMHDDYSLRPNQVTTVDNFMNNFNSLDENSPTKKMLMYAVMRYGKTFTAAECAKKMDAKFIIIMSAKTDVLEEWQEVFEGHVDFQNEWVFIYDKPRGGSNYLTLDAVNIPELMKNGKRIAIVCNIELLAKELKGVQSKNRFKQVLDYKAENRIDMVIVDETHFGIRTDKRKSATAGGKKLSVVESFASFTNESKHISKDNPDEQDVDGQDEFDSQTYSEDIMSSKRSSEQLNPKVELHLSGTPYRIVMSDEFAKDEIIAKYSFNDIYNAKLQWDEENNNLPDDQRKEEFQNPYFGFPKMFTFGFNADAEIQAIEDAKIGTTSLDKFFDVEKKTMKFVNETEVFNLFKRLEDDDFNREFKPKDNNILSILDLDGIDRKNMCRHILITFGRKAYCDAFAKLMDDRKNEFKHFNEYKIINVGGSKYNIVDKDGAKQIITECENAKQKTITVTCGKMLTGVTVPQWDTMFFMKNCNSAQEYDQARFRIQSPYIQKYTDENGNTYKRDMKPQTIFIDFSLSRIFDFESQRISYELAASNA